MPATKAKSFKATLESTGNSLRWVIARIPVDLKQAWPGWPGRRVRGEINGFAFKTSLFPGPQGVGQTLLVNKKMQSGARARAGDQVEIRLEPDLEERIATVPDELTRALKQAGGLRKWFDKLAPSIRHDLCNWAAQPKTPAARQRRAERLAEQLLLTMEGEVEPPPALRVAFQRQPLAEKGWKAMSLARKRRHLLGIFFRQTADGQAKRLEAAIEDAVDLAKRTKSGA